MKDGGNSIFFNKMDNKFSFKEFEKVALKATYNIEIGDRKIEPGEIIALFDKIQIARIAEEVRQITANGGFDNRAHVFWTTTKDEIISFSQGVFSSEQLALMVNSRMVEVEENEIIKISNQEVLESNGDGEILLSHTPSSNLWIYDKTAGKKINDYTINENVVTLVQPYLETIVNYEYDYVNGGSKYNIGQRLINGFVELEGRTRVKDDTTGQVVTGILKIPKLRLMSNLSIMLGTQAVPVVGNFSGVAVPVGSRGDTYVSEFYILNDCID